MWHLVLTNHERDLTSHYPWLSELGLAQVDASMGSAAALRHMAHADVLVSVHPPSTMPCTIELKPAFHSSNPRLGQPLRHTTLPSDMRLGPCALCHAALTSCAFGPCEHR